MKKILLCDEHPFIRHAIKTMLEAAFTGVQIEEEVNRNALLRRLAREAFNLVITDIALPGFNELQLLADIKKIHPLLPLLVLDQRSPLNFAEEVIKAGGDGYLQKDRGLREIVCVVRILMEGKKYSSA